MSTNRKVLVCVVLLILIFLLVRAYLGELALLNPASPADFPTQMKAAANTAVAAWNFGTSPLGLIVCLVSFFILFDAFKLWRRKPTQH
jgi:hypothetical protein